MTLQLISVFLSREAVFLIISAIGAIHNVFLVPAVLSSIIAVTDVYLMDTSRTYSTLSYKHITQY